MILSNKVYDVLKWITMIFLPALSVFYIGLAQTWGLPYPFEIAATLTAIDLFLAALIGVSTSNYKTRLASLNYDISAFFEIPTTGLFFSKSYYDILTFVAQIGIPAVSTLYFGLATTWGLPYVGEVVATLAAIDAFLGSLIALSTSQFHKAMAMHKLPYPAGMEHILN